MTVETVKVPNPVKQNELMYVIIHNESEFEAINVGTKTYERITKLINSNKKEVKKEGGKNESSNKMDK